MRTGGRLTVAALALAATGTISGTTQRRGVFPLDVTATDAWGFQATASMTPTVN